MIQLTTDEQLGCKTLPLRLLGHRTEGMNLSYEIRRNRGSRKLRYRLQLDGMPYTPSTGEEEDFRFSFTKQDNSLEVLRVWVRTLAPAIAMLTETTQRQERIHHFLSCVAGKIVDIAKEEAEEQSEPEPVVVDLRPVEGEESWFESVEESA